MTRILQRSLHRTAFAGTSFVPQISQQHHGSPSSEIHLAEQRRSCQGAGGNVAELVWFVLGIVQSLCAHRPLFLLTNKYSHRTRAPRQHAVRSIVFCGFPAQLPATRSEEPSELFSTQTGSPSTWCLTNPATYTGGEEGRDGLDREDQRETLWGVWNAASPPGNVPGGPGQTAAYPSHITGSSRSAAASASHPRP